MAFVVVVESVSEPRNLLGVQVSVAYRWHNQVSDQRVGVRYCLLDAARIRTISDV